MYNCESQFVIIEINMVLSMANSRQHFVCFLKDGGGKAKLTRIVNLFDC